MGSLNNFSECFFNETLLIQYQIPKKNPNYFVFKTTRNVFTNKLNFHCTTNYNNCQFQLAFTAFKNNFLYRELPNTDAHQQNLSISFSVSRFLVMYMLSEQRFKKFKQKQRRKSLSCHRDEFARILIRPMLHHNHNFTIQML